MLSCDEMAELAAALCATAETLGQTLSASAAQLMAEDLAEYGAAAIANALRTCRKELKGRLTLAAIIERVEATDGRPDPNEAWSLALAASDEFDSVVLTDEIRAALGIAGPVLNAGDKVGARMAFLSAYQRLVDDARRCNRPVRWELSMGFDPQRRLAAVEQAARLGRLPDHQAREYIAQLTHQPITQDGAAIAGLITGRQAAPAPEVREKLREIKTFLQEQRVKRDQAHEAERQRRKREHEKRVAQHIAALDELMTRQSVAQE